MRCIKLKARTNSTTDKGRQGNLLRRRLMAALTPMPAVLMANQEGCKQPSMIKNHEITGDLLTADYF